MPLFYQEFDIDSKSLLLSFQDGTVNLIMASVNVTIGPSDIKIIVYRRMPKEGKDYYSTFPKWFVLTLQYSNQSKRQIINFGHNTKYEFQFQKSDSDKNPSIHCTISHVPDSCCLQRSGHQICYIISILHPLFHLKKFRDLILSPTSSKSMFLQGVKQLFSKMLICDTLTPIKCLTDSLGWPPIGLNQPHDAVDFANKFLNMIFFRN